MKYFTRTLFAIACYTALQACTVSTDSKDTTPIFPSPRKSDPISQDPAKQPPVDNDIIKESFATGCRSLGGNISYRIFATVQATKIAVTQHTFLNSPNCQGAENDSGVSVTKSSDGIKFSLNSEKDTLTLESEGTKELATRIEKIRYSTEAGLFVQYKGTVGKGSGKKTSSSFTQIIGHSPYEGHFPYIYVRTNGRDIYPRSNPWVSSSSKTSDDYIQQMKNCKTIENIEVPAGIFRTCRLETAEEKIWIGNAPLYGVIKYQKMEGARSGSLWSFANDFAREVNLPETSEVLIELDSVGY